ncbi:MAG: aldehyde ferredoxin oxidoreductase [Thermoleophilia bacterium]
MQEQRYDILRVDLTTGTVNREAVPPELIRGFLGGKGLATHYLAQELPAGADPLGPDNPLIFMTGPLSGLFPGTTRHVVVTKSPATGGYCDTFAGGFWAWELRKAGLLGIIVKGTADKPVCLRIDDGDAVIEDAGDLAGRSIADVDDDPRFADYRVVAIGPAGENKVAFACMGNNAGRTKKGRSGYNGRGGAGAVMGSKNLKAIAVKGSQRPPLSDEALALRKEITAEINEPDSLSSWLNEAGTPIIVDWTDGVQVLPTRNWRAGSFEGAAETVGHLAVLDNLVTREACFNCPVKCGMKVSAKTGAFAGVTAEKLEYETIGLGASNTGNSDFSSIVKFADMCDELGLDTISTGAAVAFAMDCAEQGFIDSDLRFGDSEGQAKLVEDIAYRRGLGVDLAEGIRVAANRWGIDRDKVNVFEIKGLEFPAYDPRGSIGMGLAYATADRGACHMPSWPIAADALGEGEDAADPFSPEGKAEFVIGEQDGNCAEWSLVACDFVVYSKRRALKALEAIGIEMSVDDYKKMGSRIWNLTRLINLREGWTAADDALPAGLDKPLEDSGRLLAPGIFEQMKSDYYRIRRWDDEGRPTQELLEELDLEEYAERLGFVAKPGAGA